MDAVGDGGEESHLVGHQVFCPALEEGSVTKK